MVKEIIQYGHVNENGKVILYNENYLKSNIKKYFLKTSIEVIFKERFFVFSSKMRNYYFAVVVSEIRKAYLSIGEHKSKADIDYEMRDKFLYYEEVNPDTGLFEKYIHTLKDSDTKVSDKMMKEFIDMCILWAAQSLEWVIPYPSEVLGEEDMTEHQNRFNSKRVNSNTSI